MPLSRERRQDFSESAFAFAPLVGCSGLLDRVPAARSAMSELATEPDLGDRERPQLPQFHQRYGSRWRKESG